MCLVQNHAIQLQSLITWTLLWSSAKLHWFSWNCCCLIVANSHPQLSHISGFKADNFIKMWKNNATNYWLGRLSGQQNPSGRKGKILEIFHCTILDYSLGFSVEDFTDSWVSDLRSLNLQFCCWLHFESCGPLGWSNMTFLVLMLFGFFRLYGCYRLERNAIFPCIVFSHLFSSCIFKFCVCFLLF